jgi:hypothetical protein
LVFFVWFFFEREKQTGRFLKKLFLLFSLKKIGSILNALERQCFFVKNNKVNIYSNKNRKKIVGESKKREIDIQQYWP